MVLAGPPGLPIQETLRNAIDEAVVYVWIVGEMGIARAVAAERLACSAVAPVGLVRLECLIASL